MKDIVLYTSLTPMEETDLDQVIEGMKEEENAEYVEAFGFDYDEIKMMYDIIKENDRAGFMLGQLNNIISNTNRKLNDPEKGFESLLKEFPSINDNTRSLHPDLIDKMINYIE